MRSLLLGTRWTAVIVCAVMAAGVWAEAAAGAVVVRRWGTAGKAPAGKVSAGRARPTAYVGLVDKGGKAPDLDGKLTDAAWAKAPALTLDRTLDGEGRAAQPTEVRLLQDAKTLYIGIRAIEPQIDKIQATPRGHDGAVWGDDSVEFFLGIPGGDYYHFGVNAAGATYDGKGKDASWTSGMKAAAAKGAREWTAEVAIPLEKMTGGDGTGLKPVPVEWIANFNRNRHVAGVLEESAWSPTGSGDSHVPDRFGRLLFAEPPPQTAPAPEPLKGSAVEIAPVEGTDGLAVVKFNLSSLPKGAKIYRADLLIYRPAEVTGRDDEAMIDIEIYPLFGSTGLKPVPPAGAKPLALRGPWFDCFDATESVRQWAEGKPNGGFFFKACPDWNQQATCLDVTYEGKADGGTGFQPVPPQVTEVKTFHRSGQTFITWKELDDPVGRDEITWGALKQVLGNLDANRQVRYAVYRHDKPITPETLGSAEMIAAVKPLSCWNVNGRSVERAIDEKIAHQYTLQHGHWNPFASATMEGDFGRDCPMERLVISDGQPPLPRGAGLYVHTVPKAGKACYAVVTAIDGVQNTSSLTKDNAPSEPVEEALAEPEPVLQKEFEKLPYWNYPEKRLHYVVWMAPPYVNLPSQYYNWAVGVPEAMGGTGLEPVPAHGGAGLEPVPAHGGTGLEPVLPVPLELSLHRDDRSYQRTQYRIERDSVVLTPHDFPIPSWWYGYHEALGTLKSFRQGVIRNYTERRVLAFVKWAMRKWPQIDPNRVLVTGVHRSAGGVGPSGYGQGPSGALHLGLRYPEVFSVVLSGYGTPDYGGALSAARALKREGGLGTVTENIWGRLEWNLKTDTGKSVWDELNLTKIVREAPAGTELPLVTITNTGALGPLVDFMQTMVDKRQPLMASFGVWGGGKILPVSASGTWPGMIRADVRRNLPLPVFRDPAAAVLAGAPREPSGNLVVSDGVKKVFGAFGGAFRWKSDDIADTPEGCQITVWYAGREGQMKTDVTLRRLRNFKPRAGAMYNWALRSLDGSKDLAGGQTQLGQDGLLTVAGVPVRAAPARLMVAAGQLPATRKAE